MTVYEALKAIIINTTYRYFEEDRKNSIESGKLAEFVVLSQNPLTVAPSSIKEIKIFESIKTISEYILILVSQLDQCIRHCSRK